MRPRVEKNDIKQHFSDSQSIEKICWAVQISEHNLLDNFIFVHVFKKV